MNKTLNEKAFVFEYVLSFKRERERERERNAFLNFFFQIKTRVIAFCK